MSKEKTYQRRFSSTTVSILDPTKPVKIEAVKEVVGVEAVKASKGIKAVEGVEAVVAVAEINTFEEIVKYVISGKTNKEKEAKAYYKQTKSTCFVVELEEESELREIKHSVFYDNSTVVVEKKTEEEVKEI